MGHHSRQTEDPAGRFVVRPVTVGSPLGDGMLRVTSGLRQGDPFRPMAFAISFAMVGSLIFSLTVIPVLCAFFLKGGREEDTWIMRMVKRPYLPLLRWSLDNRKKLLLGALAALGLSLGVVGFLGTEFVPQLEEGALMIRGTLAPSAGLNEGIRTAGQMERLLKAYPEVIDVVSKIGRAELGGDPEPVNNLETTVTLHPPHDWESGLDKAALVQAMEETLAKIPGVAWNFSQPIALRVDELLSGAKAQLAIQLFGDDLEELSPRHPTSSASSPASRGPPTCRWSRWRASPSSRSGSTGRRSRAMASTRSRSGLPAHT